MNIMYLLIYLTAEQLLPVGVPDTLGSAKVISVKEIAVSKADTLSAKLGFTLSETLLQSTTLYVGDNGGEAALKTVSLRGLGSAHTGIYVDGVRIGNLQSGQSDLTNLGAEPYSTAVVDYAQNSISFTSPRPSFEYGRWISGQASLSTGSFGTWKPYGRLDFRLGKKRSISANAAGTFTKGNFKYGEGLSRDNNDLRQISCGIDAFGLMEGGRWHTKLHYNCSDRGAPGSISYPSSDRQADRNVYLQGRYENSFSSLYSLAASTKYAFDRLCYFSEWGDSRYDQQEVQINTNHKFRVTKWLELSLDLNFVWDKLASTAYDAERYSPAVALSAAFRTKRFSADMALEYNGATDKGGLSRNTCSPSLDLRFNIVDGLDLTAFARRAYRVPSFNELYYEGYGNPELKPEDALLSDLGLTYRKKIGSWTVKATADGFLNFLKDKIVSAPSQTDPYLWLPYNIGKVLSSGADVSAGFEYVSGQWNINAGAKYSYQSATDRTPDSSSYGEQIPYVAKHSMAANGAASFRMWRLDICWNLRKGRRDSYGDMPDWNTLDATLSKTFRFKSVGPLTLFLTGKNLTDFRYESVSGYPMPGISVSGGFNFKF